ncbi:DUF2147 domain-containing protein [Erythrobacter sanguineus]|uniref:Uncharacterized conserved protein, DUF2147 family n=2 Tax=Erythrobacter sanguineus TaxID=198312 RepID=A0A1M7SKM2_9SPHN|nr:DUF2147 domain-containing protein [Erythrobacter sanguineus]SHN59022.1 Uncharacterized conserved protein, DUF2147 family [Erythrobacter sanguineus]
MMSRITLFAQPLFALTLLAAFAIGPAPARAAEPVAGRWITAEKDGVILIAPCGKAICGTIDRFLVPPPEGLDQRDVNNPDTRLRNRKLLGMPILSGFTADGDIWRGRIYDPKSGKSYRSVIRRKGANVLEVKGCLGPFCQTQVWKKAS